MGKYFAEIATAKKAINYPNKPIIVIMEYKKISIEFENELYDGYGIETLWATVIGDYYEIDNIPFCAYGYSCGDIVSVKERDGEKFVNQIIQKSGHRTIRIIINELPEVENVREQLKQFGCESEISNYSNLIAVDVPTNADYSSVIEYLNQGVDSKWVYEIADPN